MAVVTLLEFPGMTQDQYTRVGTLLPPGAPEGILYHTCGPVRDGWRIVDVWESQEAFDQHVDGAYLPAVRRAGGREPSRREAMTAHHTGAVHRE